MIKPHNQKPLLIVGGGLIGLSLAHELAGKGKKVEVISRQRSESAGFVAAGMLAPHAEGLTGNLLKLGQLSLNRIPQWVHTIESSSGMKCGLRNCGIIVPFLNEQERDSYPTACFGQKLSRIEIEQEAPGIANKWRCGILFTQDGQIDNRRQLMRALERSCVELGVSFKEGSEVLKIIHKKQKLEGIEIKNEEGEIKYLKGDEAILCCGAWSKNLFQDIPIFPVKGQMLSIQGPKDALKRVIFGPGTYLVPREDGLVIVGATSEQEAGFKQGLTPIGQKQLKQGLNDILPCASNWPHMERWWGFRPSTPDQLPIIGKHPIKGLWVATGHYRNGVLLAAITSHLITKSICKENFTHAENLILEEFSINRFKN